MALEARWARIIEDDMIDALDIACDMCGVVRGHIWSRGSSPFWNVVVFNATPKDCVRISALFRVLSPFTVWLRFAHKSAITGRWGA